MAARTWRGNTYRFTVTAATAAAGDTYTNNGQIFTVTDAITSGTVLYCFGTGAPSASGNLVRTFGAGTNPIVFSAVTAPNTNWGTTTNWLENAVPLATDDVTFNANSRDCVINTSNRVCKSIDFTSYINTITMTFAITVSGNVTLGAGMTIAGAGTLSINANSTYTSNSKTWPNTLNPASITLTLGDNSTIQNFLHSDLGCAINNNTLTVLGNFTGGFYGISGTSTIDCSGTGTITSGAGEIQNNFTISGNYTITGTIFYSTRTLTATVGSAITDSGSTLKLGTCTWVANGKSWGNLSLLGTITMTGNATVKNLSIDGGSVGAAINSISTVSVTGNLTHGTYNISGTATIELSGSNNIIWTGGIGSISNSITINKTGTVTLTGTIIWGASGRTLTFTSGTIIPGTSTFTSVAGTIYNITNSSGFSLNNWNLASGTYTIDTNPLVVNNSLTLTGATTFIGTTGWTCGNLICTTAGTFNITLKELLTYRTRSAVSITGGTFANRPTITSSTSNLAIWTLDFGATPTLIYVNGTNIDSSLGQTVWTFGGTVSAATKNWNVGTRPGTSAYTFVN
jgi:hypothetical protein